MSILAPYQIFLRKGSVLSCIPFALMLVLLSSCGARNPFPDFRTDVTSGPAPLTVSFQDESWVILGPVSGWSWDFGDGSPVDNTENPTHTYTIPGTYTVCLASYTTSGDTASGGLRCKEDFIVVLPE